MLQMRLILLQRVYLLLVLDHILGYSLMENPIFSVICTGEVKHKKAHDRQSTPTRMHLEVHRPYYHRITHNVRSEHNY